MAAPAGPAAVSTAATSTPGSPSINDLLARAQSSLSKKEQKELTLLIMEQDVDFKVDMFNRRGRLQSLPFFLVGCRRSPPSRLTGLFPPTLPRRMGGQCFEKCVPRTCACA